MIYTPKKFIEFINISNMPTKYSSTRVKEFNGVIGSVQNVSESLDRYSRTLATKHHDPFTWLSLADGSIGVILDDRMINGNSKQLFVIKEEKE